MTTVKVKRRNRIITLKFKNITDAESYAHSVLGVRKIDYYPSKNQIIVIC